MLPRGAKSPSVTDSDGLVPVGGSRLCQVIRSRGRRAGASEEVVAEIVSTATKSVVVPCLSVLHPTGARALAIVAALRAAGVAVHSIAEPWVATVDAATLASVAAYFSVQANRERSKKTRTALGVVRASGRSIGRPRKPIPVGRAAELVEQFGYRKAGQLLGVGATSIRRAIARARASTNAVTLQAATP